MMQAADPGKLERAPDGAGLDGRRELYWIFALGAFLLGLREAVLLLRQWRRLPAARVSPDAARTLAEARK